MPKGIFCVCNRCLLTADLRVRDSRLFNSARITLVGFSSLSLFRWLLLRFARTNVLALSWLIVHPTHYQLVVALGRRASLS